MQEKLLAFCGFDPSTSALTKIYSQENISSTELGQWLDGEDFEALPSHLTCLASAAGSAVQFASVPEELIPRLRGIVKYIHTLNSGMFSGACLLGAACNRANIPVLLLEDTALYMRYANAPQRHLWQVCLGVHTAQYETVLTLAQESGYTVERYPYAAVARQGITRQIVIRPVAEDSYLWSGATELAKGNAAFLCPEAAAMLIESCQHAFRALTKANPQIFLARWCMDMKILLSHLSDSDWLRAKEIAGNEHALHHLRFLFEVYTAATAISPEAFQLFGAQKDVKKVLGLLRAHAACPETGHKLRRAYLLYRLRRPDSVTAAATLLLKQFFRKLRG